MKAPPNSLILFKSALKPGALWRRVNHRFVTRIDALTLIPAGTPVMVKVKKKHRDCAEFEFVGHSDWPHSFLTWPMPDTFFGSGGFWTINDAQGKLWLTYERINEKTETP